SPRERNSKSPFSPSTTQILPVGTDKLRVIFILTTCFARDFFGVKRWFWIWNYCQTWRPKNTMRIRNDCLQSLYFQSQIGLNTTSIVQLALGIQRQEVNITLCLGKFLFSFLRPC